jgi:DNA-binding transcriptional MerR regulator
MAITMISENAVLTPMDHKYKEDKDSVDFSNYGSSCRTQFEQMEDEAYSDDFQAWARRQGYSIQELDTMLNEEEEEDAYDSEASELENETLFYLTDTLLDKLSDYFSDQGVPNEFYKEYLELYNFVNSQYEDDDDDEESTEETDYTQD